MVVDGEMLEYPVSEVAAGATNCDRFAILSAWTFTILSQFRRCTSTCRILAYVLEKNFCIIISSAFVQFSHVVSYPHSPKEYLEVLRGGRNASSRIGPRQAETQAVCASKGVLSFRPQRLSFVEGHYELLSGWPQRST